MHARDYYPGLPELSSAQLFDEEKPSNDARPARAEEILPVVPQAHIS
jgi:hypothetical protein